MTRRLAAALLLLCLLAAGAVAVAPRVSAAGPAVWRIEGARAFLEGELTALSVDALGRLRLGPLPRLVSDLAAPNAWAVARDAKGALYLGTGNDGRVLRVEGKAGSAVFDSDELEVHAVAVGPDGRVYAGTSPDGAVYAIEATGRATRFFDPEEKYIWAIAFDKSGNLYVATGGEGKVYRVDRSGRAAVYLATSDAHVLSLAIDARGRLFAGTSPEGRVYRVDEQGRAFVIYDSPFHEIRALDVAADGALYAAAVDGRGSETGRAATPSATGATAAAGPVAEVTVSESFSIVAPGAAAPVPVGTAAAESAAAAKAPRGAVLRLTPDGEGDTLWSSTEDAPHAIAALDGGGVLVGTGDKGNVYRVRGAGDWSLVATLPAEHVTAIIRAAGDDAVVVTSNPARVYAIDATPAAQGIFVSTVKDAETAARWGRVFWEGAAPPGTSVRLETRVGNTDRPDATWSDWVAGGDAAGGPGHGDRARFCQLRVTLQGRGGSTPAVETVAAAFLQRNLPPEVKSITVHGPGEVFQKPISVSGDPEILGLATESAGDRSAAVRGGAASPPAIAFSRKLYQRGLRTFSWQADDPNGDALSYDVLYRAVGEERWRPLRQGLDEPVIAWDTTAVPNGRYVVRVVASDAPANPPALATTASRDSVSFEIDNSPPAIEAAYDAGRRLVRVEVKDETAVRRLDFSIDGSRWEEIHPVDGIADSPRERYEIPLPSAVGVPRLMVLRASDLLGNVSTLRVDLP